MNFINLSNKQVCTPMVLKMQTGIDEYDIGRAQQAGYGRIEYCYPECDTTYYTITARPEPTPMAGDKYRFVQEFNVVEHPLKDVRTIVKAKVTERRWQVEFGGIEVNGKRVATDIAAQNDESLPDDVRAALKAHADACFARERELHKMCDEATEVVDLRNIMENEVPRGWPVVAAVACATD